MSQQQRKKGLSIGGGVLAFVLALLISASFMVGGASSASAADEATDAASSAATTIASTLTDSATTTADAAGLTASSTTDQSATTTEQPAAATSDEGLSPQSGENSIKVTMINPTSWPGEIVSDDGNGNYVFTPSSSGNMGIQAQVTVTSSRAYAIGEMTFDLPSEILTYRDGTTKVSLDFPSGIGIPEYTTETADYGSSVYAYTVNKDVDGNPTGTITIRNVKEIPSNDIKVFSMSWTVTTGKVKSGTVVDITPTNVSATDVTATGTTLTFKNTVTPSTVAKEATNNGNGVRTLPPSALSNDVYFGQSNDYYTSGAGSFANNYYMVYKITATTTGSSPNNLSFYDQLGDDDVKAGAKIIGMTTDANGIESVKTIMASSGTYAVGEVDKDGNATGTMSTLSTGSTYCFVLVQYPRSAYKTLTAGDSLYFLNKATFSTKGVDDTEWTNCKTTADATASWTMGQIQAGGGDGSTKGIYNSGNGEGVAALLQNNIDATNVFTYRLYSDTWYAKEETSNPKTYSVPRHNAYAIDDTMQIYNATLKQYTTLDEDSYTITGITIKDAKEYAFKQENIGGLGDLKGKDDTTTGHFEVYYSSTRDGAYTKLGDDIPYSNVYNTNYKVDISSATGGIAKYYVEYVGSDFRSTFYVDSTVTLKGAAAVWNTFIPTDTSTVTLMNNAAFPTTLTDTGKLVDNQANKSYCTTDGNDTYQNNWSASGTYTQQNEQLTYDNKEWGSLYPTDRTGNGLLRSWSGTPANLTQLLGSNSTKKYQIGSLENDTVNGKVIVTYGQTGEEHYLATGDNLNQAVNLLNTKLKRDNATFYDLLPAGETYVKDSATVYGTASDKSAEFTKIEVIDDYKGTGRQMVIFTVKDTSGSNTFIPAGTNEDGSPRAASGSTTNLLVGSGYLQSGFHITYKCEVAWDNMADASAVPSDTAYQIPGQALLGTAYADQVNMGDNVDTLGVTRSNVSPQNTVYVNKTQDDGLAFNNLKKINNYDETQMDGRALDTIYSNLTTAFQANYSSDSGLSKKVKAANANLYATDTTVYVGDEYQYRLTYNNSSYLEVQDLVMFDSLENANSGATNWKGTLKSIDTSVAEAKGVKPVIYYSTEATTSQDITDAAVWSTTAPTDADGNTDLSQVKAVAVDLTWTDDHQTDKFTLKQLSSISVTLNFSAPKSLELDDAVNTAASKQDGKAYNSAGAKLTFYVKQGGAGTSATVSDPEKYTSVTLMDIRQTINMVKLDDQSTPLVVPGAQFKLEGEIKVGDDTKWVTLSPDDVWSASEDDDTLGVKKGDLVYGNADYEPADASKPTLLKLYPSGSIYSDGTASAVNRSYTGNYRLTEIAAPEGYELADPSVYNINVEADDPENIVTVTYEKDGQTVTATKNDDGDYVITDAMQTAEFSLLKENDATPAAPVEGVGFTLFKEDGTTVATNKSGDPIGTEQLTPASGILTFSDIPAGTYKLVETTVPHGIVDPEEARTYTVTSNKGVITIEGLEDSKNADGQYVIDNERIRRTISGLVFNDTNWDGTYQDATVADNEERLIEGATVTLTDTDGNAVTDIDGNAIDPVTTDADGTYKFENLAQGTYNVTVSYDGTNYTVTKKFDGTAPDEGNLATQSADDANAAVIEGVDTDAADLSSQDIGIHPIKTITKTLVVDGQDMGAGDETNPITITPDNSLSYKIVVTNKATNELDVIPDVTVSDSVPEGLSVSKASDDANVSGNVVTWSGQTLKMGEKEYTIDVTITDANASTEVLQNTAKSIQKNEEDSDDTMSNTVYSQYTKPAAEVTPKTGDTTSAFPMVALTIGGLALIGFALRRRLSE